MENNIEYVENKCYGCKNRVLGCHSTCEDYKKYKKYIEQLKQKEMGEKMYHHYTQEERDRKIRQRKIKGGNN